MPRRTGSGRTAPNRATLDLSDAVRTTLRAVDPAVTIPRLARRQIKVPPRIAAEQSETFVEAMAYPVFDLPMYAPLRRPFGRTADSQRQPD